MLRVVCCGSIFGDLWTESYLCLNCEIAVSLFLGRVKLTVFVLGHYGRTLILDIKDFSPKFWSPILNSSTKFQVHHRILKMFHDPSCDMCVRVF